MGMLACYTEVSSRELADMLTKVPEERLDACFDLEEDGNHSVLDLDKLWDGLHCLLTGVSASKPIEGEPCSEAVIGTATFSDEDAEFIAYIKPQRLSQIVAALDKFDVEKALAKFKPQDFAKKEIYPNIWVQDMEEDLKQELRECFVSLKDFYHQLVSKNKGVIISIT